MSQRQVEEDEESESRFYIQYQELSTSSPSSPSSSSTPIQSHSIEKRFSIEDSANKQQDVGQIPSMEVDYSPPSQQQQQQQQQQQFYSVRVNDNCSFVLRQCYTPRYYDYPHQDKILSLDIGDGGSGGIVIACIDLTQQHECSPSVESNVAVKKIAGIFAGEAPHIMKRIWRELALLRLLRGHPNLVHLRDVYVAEDSGDLYLVMDMFNTDLRKDMYFAMKKNNPYDSQKTKYILYGILKGLQYMHQRGVLHRDLKPANILLSSSKVAICDFGHANSIRSREEKTPNESKYVVTRMYRPPEVILESDIQTYTMDIFSVGCIFAEMLFCEQQPPVYKHLFPADDSCSMRTKGGSLKHISHIISILGTPELEDIVGSQSALWILTSQEWFQNKTEPIDMHKEFFPNSSRQAVDLLQRMLVFNPNKRISVDEALLSDYFSDIRQTGNMQDIFSTPTNLDTSPILLQRGEIDEEEFKNRVYEEVRLFRLT